MNTISRIALAAGLTTVLLVSGCGSDDHVTSETSTAVPDSAGVSPAAFTAFLLSLDPNDETSEPLTLSDNFAVPDDETSEPQPLS